MLKRRKGGGGVEQRRNEENWLEREISGESRGVM